MTDMANILGAVAGGAITIYALDTLLKKPEERRRQAKSRKLRKVL